MSLNIKRAIKERGLEVKEVAKILNITPTGLSQHINGNPSVEVLERIAKAIGCDISELFDKSEDINGYMEIKGVIYKITSKEDLKKMIDKL